MDWDDEPRLGIRWFWGKAGNPLSTGYPIWFVVSASLRSAHAKQQKKRKNFMQMPDNYDDYELRDEYDLSDNRYMTNVLPNFDLTPNHQLHLIRAAEVCVKRLAAT